MGRPKKDSLPSGIYKTPSGYKLAYKTIGNITKYVHLKTLEEAIELKSKYETLREYGVDLNLKEPTITELFICHMKYFKMNKVAVTTLNNMMRKFNKNVQPVLGNADIRELKLPHLQNFADDLQKKYSMGYTWQIMGLVNSCYELAIYLNLIEKNLCKLVKLEASKTSLLAKRKLELDMMNNGVNNTRYISKEVADYIFARLGIDNIYSKVLQFQYETGLRCGEVLALTWDKVDYERRLLKVFNILSYDTDPVIGKKTFMISTSKTLRSYRIIPINKKAIDILNSIDHDNTEHTLLCSDIASESSYIKMRGFIFTDNSMLMNVKTIDSKLKTLVINNNNEYHRKSNLGLNTDDMILLDKHSSHDFRHTFVTNVWKRTHDPILLRDLVGHTSAQFTLDTYVSAPIDIMRSAVDSDE